MLEAVAYNYVKKYLSGTIISGILPDSYYITKLLLSSIKCSEQLEYIIKGNLEKFYKNTFRYYTVIFYCTVFYFYIRKIFSDN